jgi:hypothetical protein
MSKIYLQMFEIRAYHSTIGGKLRLRATVEKRLPVGPDEVQLSAGARRLVFRGGYLFPSRVTNVGTGQNYNPSSKDAYPYRVTVTRTDKQGCREESGDGRYDTIPEGYEELQDPRALVRATHVERFSRRLKLATVGAVLATTGTLMGLQVSGDLVHAETPPAASSTLKPCGDLVTGQEALLPYRKIKYREYSTLVEQPALLAGSTIS